MSQQELQELVALMRAAPLDLAAPPTVLREQAEQMLATAPLPDGVILTSTSVGGIPALKSSCPGMQENVALLYLHGGGYVFGSPRSYQSVAARLGRAARAVAFTIAYRLAPETPFPGAVEDAVAAYRGLLVEGIEPGNIVVAGDSAGGGLAIAALACARDAGLPMPAAACAISPWANLACDGASMSTKAAEDPALTHTGLKNLAGLYLNGVAPTNPLASPLLANLRGLPPLLLQVGSAEILLDDAVDLARAAGAAGVETRLDIWPHMVHVWHAFGFMLSEGRAAIEAAGQFLQQHTCADDE